MESGPGSATAAARNFPHAARELPGAYYDAMITPEMLEILRCPMDPKRDAKLVVEDSHLCCSRCRLLFRIREGFPSLLIEEATLPEGCPSFDQLPCQRK